MQGEADVANERVRYVTEIAPGQTRETRTVDGVRYIQVASDASSEITTPWAAHPAPANDDLAGSDALQPGVVLDRLRQEAGVNPVRVEADDVRGVPTEHYRLELDSDAARRILGASAVAEQPSVAVDIDLWIDADRRLRRIEMSIWPEGDTEAQRAAWTRMEFFDFGTQLDLIEAPPEGQVTYFDSPEAYRQAAHRPPPSP